MNRFIKDIQSTPSSVLALEYGLSYNEVKYFNHLSQKPKDLFVEDEKYTYKNLGLIYRKIKQYLRSQDQKT